MIAEVLHDETALVRLIDSLTEVGFLRACPAGNESEYERLVVLSWKIGNVTPAGSVWDKLLIGAVLRTRDGQRFLSLIPLMSLDRDSLGRPQWVEWNSMGHYQSCDTMPIREVATLSVPGSWGSFDGSRLSAGVGADETIESIGIDRAAWRELIGALPPLPYSESHRDH
jgi:hypothetical protein